MTGIRKTTSPRVNLNGTDAQALFDQQNDVVRAARALADALAKATPHGRDYQTCECFYHERAVEEHRAFQKRVEDIQLAAEVKCLDIFEQAERKIKVTHV